MQTATSVCYPCRRLPSQLSPQSTPGATRKLVVGAAADGCAER